MAIPELKTSLLLNEDSFDESDITTDRLLTEADKEEIKRAMFQNAQTSIIEGNSESYSSVEGDDKVGPIE